MKFVNDPTTDADDRAHLEQVRSDAWLWPGVIVIIVIGSLLLSGFSRDEKIRDKAMSGVGGITLGIFGYLKGRSEGKRSGGMLVPEPGDMPEPTPPSLQRPNPTPDPEPELLPEPEPFEPAQPVITQEPAPDVGLQEDRGIQPWSSPGFDVVEPTRDEPKQSPGFHYEAIQQIAQVVPENVPELRDRVLNEISQDVFKFRDGQPVAYRGSGRVEKC